MLSIRLTRMGAKKRPSFRVVVAEGRSGLQGDVVDTLGTYNPLSKPAEVNVDKAKLDAWLKKGARPSDTVRTLIAKHLTRDLSATVETPAVQ